MKDIMGMMSKVREMQGRMEEMQAELAEMEIEGQAGGGMVRVTMSGKGDIRKVRIDPALMKPDEAEIVEDLVMAAAADAKSKVEGVMQSKMADVTGGLPIPPGLKLF